MKSALVKLHVSVFLWGFTGVLGRLISLNEGLLVWYRILLTLVILFLIRKFSSSPKHSVSRREKWLLYGIGTLIAFHWVCFYGSIKYSNVSIALTCLSAAGLFTSFVEPILLKAKMRFAEIMLGLLGVAGIFLIFHFDPRYKTGIILGLIATVLSVLFSIFNKKFVEKHSTEQLMSYELTGGFIVLTLCMPFYLYYLPYTHLFPTMADWGWLLLLSAFCTVLAMYLSLQALKHISVFTQNLTLNLEPVYGIILAFVIYRENQYLSPGFYAGFSLILTAVIVQMLRTCLQVRKLRRMEV